MKPRRVLVLTHPDFVPPDTLDGYTDAELGKVRWMTDYNVVSTLRTLGHEVQVLGAVSDLAKIGEAIATFKPHVTFNLIEEFHDEALFDSHVVSYLELLRQPYTGCNPRGLILARDKALSKKILAYHRLPVPKFAVFPMGRKPRRPKRLEFPLMVKCLTEDASLGIAQASVVYSDEKLAERVAYIHQKLGSDAIAEQFIEGRELYVAVMGHRRLTTLPVWELMMKKLPEGAPNIATAKVKFDEDYQKKIGLTIARARDLSPALEARLARLSKRVYKALELTGYARLDWRLTDDERIYLLEANPNPDVGYGQEFAEAAEHAGIEYDQLLEKLLTLGLRYRPLKAD